MERTLHIAVATEPKTISAGSSPGSGTTVGTSIRIFNALLDLVDDRGVPHPYLAEVLPELNTASWQVFPDGRMETRYTLRPNLRWHDGTPLAAEDFAFAWRVDSTPDLGINTVAPLNQVEDVLAPDDRTVVIRWRRLYPDARVTQSGGHMVGLAPFPRHLLAEPYREAAEEGRWETFTGHPYWTRDFVGLGPFRLVRWEPGSFIEGAAFDGHALGRPRIDRVRIRFVSDANAGLVTMLSGDVHYGGDQAVEFLQGLELKRHWADTRAGTVITSAQAWTGIAVQFRPEYVSPRAVLDLRVRRALAHAIDKRDLNQALFEGEGIPADTVFAPSMAYFPTIDRALTKYSYDSRRSEQLMNEAGFVKAPDGFYASADGRLSMELKSTGGARNDMERSVVGSGWRQAGFDITESVLPAALSQDRQARSVYPSFFATSVGLSEASLLGAYSTANIPSAANRWTGNNPGGWSHADYDRILDEFNGTLDADERIRQRIGMAQILSDQLPWLPLYYRINAVAHLAALRGLPQTSSPGSTGIFSWNIHLWELG